MSEKDEAGTYRCMCGVDVPPGTEYDPGCRHCERIKVNRLMGEIA